MDKIKVGIIYGGNSCEHEASKMSAESVLQNINRDIFEVVEIYVDMEGNFNKSLLSKIDIAFLAWHGPNCEDGTFQKYLEGEKTKYTGSGPEASKINLDKKLQKRYFADTGLKTVGFVSLAKDLSSVEITERVKETAGFPCVVKPTNTGSSLGIAKVNNQTELTDAISAARKINNKIIIEKYIENPRELEVSIVGNDELLISDPGEVLTGGELYSYEAKYFKPFKTTDKPENLSPETITKIKDWAEKAYRVTGCRGFARVDFFLTQNGELYINEINTLPGFTKISMFPKMMMKMGLSYKDLISKIIELGME